MIRRAVVPMLALLPAMASPLVAAASDMQLEAESMRLPRQVGQPYADSSASGGRALLLARNGSATGSVTTAKVRQLLLRLRSDSFYGPPQVRVEVDGVRVLQSDVRSTRWTDISVTGSWSAGRHSVRVSFLNDRWQRGVGDRNLRLDKLTFQSTRSGGNTGGSTPPSAGTGTGTPPATGGGSAPSPAQTVTMYVTGYGAPDNDPPGSLAIAYPGSAPRHREAGGVGTYADPVTVATGQDRINSNLKPGSRVYIPQFKKYGVIEDLCASCSGNWIDIFDGSRIGDDGRAVASCQSRHTGNFPVELNPPQGREVNTRPLYDRGVCTP